MGQWAFPTAEEGWLDDECAAVEESVLRELAQFGKLESPDLTARPWVWENPPGWWIHSYVPWWDRHPLRVPSWVARLSEAVPYAAAEGRKPVSDKRLAILYEGRVIETYDGPWADHYLEKGGILI